jgi:hypothetical protein
MNRSKLFYSVKNAVESGCSVSSGLLTICDLADYVKTRKTMERRFQVECNDSRMRWSEVYYKLDIALDKFLAIRSVLVGNEYD